MRDSAVVLRYGQQAAGKGITNLAWAGDTADTREQRLLVSLANGSLALYDEQTSQLLGERAGSGDIVGLTVITPDSHSSLVQQPTIITCTAKGHLSLTPLAQLTSPNSSTSSPPISFSLGENITRMRLCSLTTSSLVASGGKEQLVRLHDLSTQQCTFKAKNVPHNKLNLRTPVHTTDLVWLPDSDTQLVEGTAHHAVRLFDVRVGKQPVVNVSSGEHAVTSLAVSGDGLQLIAADVTGRIVNIDRRKAAITSAYHGIGGSVRSIALTADDSQLATASLDRHLRIYDRQSRHMTKKVYMKQKLNACLWSTQVDAATAVKGEDEEDGVEGEGEEGEEQMWRELDERRKLAAKKRRVKEEEKAEEEEVQEVEKPASAGTEDNSSKKRRVVAMKQEEQADEEEEEEEEEDEDFAAGALDDEDDEGDEEQDDEDESDEEGKDEHVELSSLPPSRKKAQPVRRAR